MPIRSMKLMIAHLRLTLCIRITLLGYVAVTPELRPCYDHLGQYVAVVLLVVASTYKDVCVSAASSSTASSVSGTAAGGASSTTTVASSAAPGGGTGAVTSAPTGGAGGVTNAPAGGVTNAPAGSGTTAPPATTTFATYECFEGICAGNSSNSACISTVTAKCTVTTAAEGCSIIIDDASDMISMDCRTCDSANDSPTQKCCKENECNNKDPGQTENAATSVKISGVLMTTLMINVAYLFHSSA